ncbi:MAG: hypothetical protein RSB37_00660 [Acetivibrio sp.]
MKKNFLQVNTNRIAGTNLQFAKFIFDKYIKEDSAFFSGISLIYLDNQQEESSLYESHFYLTLKILQMNAYHRIQKTSIQSNSVMQQKSLESMVVYHLDALKKNKNEKYSLLNQFYEKSQKIHTLEEYKQFKKEMEPLLKIRPLFAKENHQNILGKSENMQKYIFRGIEKTGGIGNRTLGRTVQLESSHQYILRQLQQKRWYITKEKQNKIEEIMLYCVKDKTSRSRIIQLIDQSQLTKQERELLIEKTKNNLFQSEEARQIVSALKLGSIQKKQMQKFFSEIEQTLTKKIEEEQNIEQRILYQSIFKKTEIENENKEVLFNSTIEKNKVSATKTDAWELLKDSDFFIELIQEESRETLEETITWINQKQLFSAQRELLENQEIKENLDSILTFYIKHSENEEYKKFIDLLLTEKESNTIKQTKTDSNIEKSIPMQLGLHYEERAKELFDKVSNFYIEYKNINKSKEKNAIEREELTKTKEIFEEANYFYQNVNRFFNTIKPNAIPGENPLLLEKGEMWEQLISIGEENTAFTALEWIKKQELFSLTRKIQEKIPMFEARQNLCYLIRYGTKKEYDEFISEIQIEMKTKKASWIKSYETEWNSLAYIYKKSWNVQNNPKKSNVNMHKDFKNMANVFDLFEIKEDTSKENFLLFNIRSVNEIEETILTTYQFQKKYLDFFKENETNKTKAISWRNLLEKTIVEEKIKNVFLSQKEKPSEGELKRIKSNGIQINKAEEKTMEAIYDFIERTNCFSSSRKQWKESNFYSENWKKSRILKYVVQHATRVEQEEFIHYFQKETKKITSLEENKYIEENRVTEFDLKEKNRKNILYMKSIVKLIEHQEIAETLLTIANEGEEAVIKETLDFIERKNCFSYSRNKMSTISKNWTNRMLLRHLIQQATIVEQDEFMNYFKSERKNTISMEKNKFIESMKLIKINKLTGENRVIGTNKLTKENEALERNEDINRNEDTLYMQSIVKLLEQQKIKKIQKKLKVQKVQEIAETLLTIIGEEEDKKEFSKSRATFHILQYLIQHAYSWKPKEFISYIEKENNTKIQTTLKVKDVQEIKYLWENENQKEVDFYEKNFIEDLVVSKIEKRKTNQKTFLLQKSEIERNNSFLEDNISKVLQDRKTVSLEKRIDTYKAEKELEIKNTDEHVEKTGMEIRTQKKIISQLQTDLQEQKKQIAELKQEETDKKRQQSNLNKKLTQDIIKKLERQLDMEKVSRGMD